MFTKDAFEAMTEANAIAAAHTATQAELPHGAALFALPNTYTVHDLEKTLQYRRRARGVMKSRHIASFATYVKTHSEMGAAVFVDQQSMAATAVLNLGEPEGAGQADNLAEFTAQNTAAAKAMIAITGGAKTQLEVAEWLEDWADLIECSDDAGPVAHKKAVAAVRRITIESLRKQENTEESLSSSRSAFESVAATSKEPIPTLIRITCEPYQGLPVRTFVLRLGIRTGDKPAIVLRQIHAERHQEEMADELAELLRTALKDEMPVLVGSYSASR